MPALDRSGNVLDDVSDAVDDGGSRLHSSCFVTYLQSLTGLIDRISQRHQRQALGRRVRVRRNKGQGLVQTV